MVLRALIFGEALCGGEIPADTTFIEHVGRQRGGFSGLVLKLARARFELMLHLAEDRHTEPLAIPRRETTPLPVINILIY